MTAAKAYSAMLAVLDSRMPDTELLGEGPVEHLTRRRMRILNATAQAMIEEAGGAELANHAPHFEGKRCICGLYYTKPFPEGHRIHQDRVLRSVIEKLTRSIKTARQVNWRDVKDEADANQAAVSN